MAKRDLILGQGRRDEGTKGLRGETLRVCFVFGTRPEVIKCAPVIRCLAERDGFEVQTVLTAQHREMSDQVIDVFGVPVTVDLDLMRAGQTLSSLTAGLVERVTGALRELMPDCVMVQGDTTSCFVGALAGFYEGIPVGHLEAGLRTQDVRQPFPEEMNRRLVGSLASFHFAPTEGAKANLLQENVAADRIWVTGNTGIDALRIVSESATVASGSVLADVLAGCDGTVMTVTSHRRENQPFMSGIASAIYELIEAVPDLHVVFPVHLSPAVRDAVMPILHGVERCHLLEPLAYDQFVALMKRSDVILTDSGGIQEEAPYLGKPVLVMRRKTERPEAVDAGTVMLVGDDQATIFDRTLTLLHDGEMRERMGRAVNPYGDGYASDRVANVLMAELGTG